MFSLNKRRRIGELNLLLIFCVKTHYLPWHGEIDPVENFWVHLLPPWLEEYSRPQLVRFSLASWSTCFTLWFSPTSLWATVSEQSCSLRRTFGVGISRGVSSKKKKVTFVMAWIRSLSISSSVIKRIQSRF